MGWYAYIGEGEGWNYTHNTNPMINEVLVKLKPDLERYDAFWGDDVCWWKTLDGMTGTEGAQLLSLVVGALMEMPEHFKAMSPENGWGDYDSLLRILVEMRDKSAWCPDDKWEMGG